MSGRRAEGGPARSTTSRQPSTGWPRSTTSTRSASSRAVTRPEVTSPSGSRPVTASQRGRVGPIRACGPLAAIAQAGVLDLQRAHEEGLGGGAVAGLLGETTSERFAAASPAALAPLGVAQLLVHGTADDIVPVTQSRIHAELDSGAELVELEGADHFDVIDPSHRAWDAVVEWLAGTLAGTLDRLCDQGEQTVSVRSRS